MAKLNSTPHETPPALSPRKRLVFLGILLLLPIFALGLLEGGLRLAGFGGYPPILKKAGQTGQGTLVISDPAGAATYFFANRQRPGYNEQYCFYQPKGTNTVRIFIVGESAAKGFPEPRNLAASAFLGEMLRDAWPDRIVEIINLGTTAVASFPVLEIMTEALDYEPDLIIVSTGHNEFFGTYGVASRGRAGGKPWMLRANRWLYSLALVQAVGKLFPDTGAQENKTLMEVMVGKNYVAPDDPQRQAAAENLAHNVGAMIDRCRSRDVPVLVCTQPSNERDLAPVGTEKTGQLGGEKQSQLNQFLSAGMELCQTNPPQAVENLKAALAIYPDHARAHFYLGKALYAASNFTEASAHFAKARDLDSLPWRTPGLSQAAIVRAAQEHGAPVCDLEKTFRAASPGGAIGWELMDDHVHPTLAGEALMARALVECLTQMDGKLRVSTNAYAHLASGEDYAHRLGDNPLDRYTVAHTMRVIFDIPFMRQNNPDAYERFNQAANEIENSQPPEIREAMHEWQTKNPHAGGKRPLTGMAARVLMRQGKYAEALELLRIAQKSVPEYTSWHMEYVYFAMACREKINGTLSAEDKAIALEEIKQGIFLLQRGFSESGMTERYIGRLHQLRGEFAEAIPYLLVSRKKLTGTDLVAADQALVVSYFKTSQLEKARQVVDNGIQHSGVFSSYYQQMLAGLLDLEKTNLNTTLKPDTGSH
ncbi:MAG: tetratricopeptide repeat protein [Verrucomicrobiales bacterium]|nr:tetratricopeptide repeat protein [Verrucomicrobiales bacterium]